MHQQLERYTRLLITEQAVREDRIAICGQNDTVCCYGATDLSRLAEQILAQLGSSAVIVAEPLHPFPCFLAQRSSPDCQTLIPGDSESKSSLHDIPVIRSMPDRKELLNSICAALRRRKGCIVEGIGMVSHGSLTVEQAYITWSSLMHATTIMYLADLLARGPAAQEEMLAVQRFRRCLRPLAPETLLSSRPAPTTHQDIMHEICRIGQLTVQLGLVDSFFGNVSWTSGDIMYISQTSARLDELATQIDPVPFDESTTTGLTASSELPAHRAIVKATDCRAILHGHPRFPVVMSFFCRPGKHAGIQTVNLIPVVGGEGGAGGLAESLPKAFLQTEAKAVIAQGHGVFALSNSSFDETLSLLADVEQKCREQYFFQLREKYQL